MPIYEYRCRNCGLVTEILEGVGENRESPRCRHCGGNMLTKMISASFVRVGSKTGSGMSCPFPGEGRKVPEDCHGNWPANDDYIKLQID
ncbi:MAG: zinc ribbon domain-containing protein [Bacillota bacterium]